MAYAFTPLLGYDQFLLIKNTTHVDSWIHVGAYAIRPYRAMNNFYRERILSMQMAGYILGYMQYTPTWVRSTSTDQEYYP